jgi:NACHT domain
MWNDYILNHTNSSKGMKYLEANVASGAFHNSHERFDPPKCHEGTRIAILKRITDWVEDLHTPRTPIMWLYGPAGAGKSAIVQTIADRVLPGQLAASFFFSRTAAERNNEKRLIPTIAYQLTLSVPTIREFVVKAVEADPLIFSRSLETQLETLITTPWTKISESTCSLPKLITIDGLDECHGSDAQRAILETLSATLTRNQLPFFFLITSRPEQAIRAAFKCDDLRKLSCHLILDDSFSPAEDIELFLDDQFTEIKEKHPLTSIIPNTWPSQDAIQTLVRKSSGQFIYASTVIKYVKSQNHQPLDRLKTVLEISSANGDTPFAQLDALYTQILLSADDINRVLRILGVILVWNDPIFVSLSGGGSEFVPTPPVVEALLLLKEGDVVLALSDLYSILDVPELGTDQYHRSPIRFLHASLSDFFVDHWRSGELFVDPPRFHEDLARCCLNHVFSTTISKHEYPDVHIYSLFRLVGHIIQLPPTCKLLNDLKSINLAMILSKMVAEKDHSFWKRNMLMWLSWSKVRHGN